MSGMDPKKKDLNWKFIKEMAELMSDNNKDGLGYSALDKQGNLFGERWLFNWQAFENNHKMTQPKKREHEKFSSIKQMLKDFVNLEDEEDEVPFEKYGNFGKRTDEITSITLHTRMATSSKGFQNVHPFIDVDKDTSLVHNGIICNHSKVDELRSTCDSERILNKYLEHEVNKIPVDIQNMVDQLRGYFACGIYSRDRDNKRILDVFNTRANLSGAIVKELNCFVLSTQIDDIKTACRRLGLTIVSKNTAVKENTLMRLDPITGKVLLIQEYKDSAKPDHNSSAYGRYNHHRGSYGGYNESVADPEWEAWVEEQNAKAAAATQSNNVVPITTNTTTTSEAANSTYDKKEVLEWTKLTESQRVEVIELRKGGMADEDIAIALAKRNVDIPTLPEAISAQVQEIIKRDKEVNKIIQDHSVDPLNEREADLDGYFQSSERDMWLKKDKVKH